MPWNRVVLVATVILIATTLLVAGVHQCKGGWVNRAGHHMYDQSGVVLNGSDLENEDCDSGECGMSIFVEDNNKEISAVFYCADPSHLNNMARNWTVDLKMGKMGEAYFSCIAENTDASRSCNDPTLIFNVDGDAKKENEEMLQQIGIVINTNTIDDSSSTPAATEETSSEAPADGESATDIGSDATTETPVPETVDSDEDATRAADETPVDATPGVPQCKQGWLYRDGIQMYTASGVINDSTLNNVDCESGECALSMNLHNQTEISIYIYAEFSCSRLKQNLSRNWTVFSNLRTALFTCIADTSETSRPCNDPSLIFDVDGQAKIDNEEALRQTGIIINDIASVSVSTTPEVTEETSSEAPDVTEDSVTEIETGMDTETSVPEKVDDFETAISKATEIPASPAVAETPSEGSDSTVDTISAIDAGKETEAPTPDSSETVDNDEGASPAEAEINATPPNNPTEHQDRAESTDNYDAVTVTSSKPSPVVDDKTPSQPIENETVTLDNAASSAPAAAPAASGQEHSERTPDSVLTSPEKDDSADNVVAHALGNATVIDGAASPSVSAAAAATRVSATGATGLTLAGVTLLAVISFV